MKEHVGRALRRRREELGLSLRQVAARMEVSAGHLSNCEKGRRNPTFKTLKKWVEALWPNTAESAQRLGELLGVEQTLSRREFLKGGMAAGIGLAAALAKEPVRTSFPAAAPVARALSPEEQALRRVQEGAERWRHNDPARARELVEEACGLLHVPAKPFAVPAKSFAPEGREGIVATLQRVSRRPGGEAAFMALAPLRGSLLLHGEKEGEFTPAAAVGGLEGLRRLADECDNEERRAHVYHRRGRRGVWAATRAGRPVDRERLQEAITHLEYARKRHARGSNPADRVNAGHDCWVMAGAYGYLGDMKKVKEVGAQAEDYFGNDPAIVNWYLQKARIELRAAMHENRLNLATRESIDFALQRAVRRANEIWSPEILANAFAAFGALYQLARDKRQETHYLLASLIAHPYSRETTAYRGREERLAELLDQSRPFDAARLFKPGSGPYKHIAAMPELNQRLREVTAHFRLYPH